jgi:hypothetical protein
MQIDRMHYLLVVPGYFRGAIAWSSKKQRTIALSTTAKCMALTEGANQFIWLRRFIQELGIDQSQRSDNLGAITNAY